MTDETQLYDIKAVAKRLSVSQRTVEQLIHDEKLASFKVGRLRRISDEALTDYIARQKESA